MGRADDKNADVAATPEAAARLARPPLLVLEPLREFLDRHGLGDGPLAVKPIGDGHSNVSYLIRRGDLKMVLRRPPRGPLPPSAHDVLREARLLRALAPTPVPAPEVLVTCEDEEVIGAPFYVMGFVEGQVLMSALPPELDQPDHRAQIGDRAVEALAGVHAVDLDAVGLSDLGRPDGYLQRQIERFSSLSELYSDRRQIKDLELTADWLVSEMPDSETTALVHGDYRLGNLMFDLKDTPRLAGILDWELSTIGDPLADVGYLTAMWADAADPRNAMLDLGAITRQPGFRRRGDLAERYAEITGRSIDNIAWYQVLAIWKAAIFLEGSYGRYLDGTTDDAFFAGLGEDVPELARIALERTRLRT